MKRDRILVAAGGNIFGSCPNHKHVEEIKEWSGLMSSLSFIGIILLSTAQLSFTGTLLVLFSIVFMSCTLMKSARRVRERNSLSSLFIPLLVKGLAEKKERDVSYVQTLVRNEPQAMNGSMKDRESRNFHQREFRKRMEVPVTGFSLSFMWYTIPASSQLLMNRHAIPR